MVGIKYLLLLSLVIPVSAQACIFGIFGCNDLDIDTDGITEATEKIRQAADSITEGLVLSADAVDPIGLKKLLDDNEDLRLALDSLRANLEQLPHYDPVIVLEGQEVRLTINQTVGEFVINAWIDDVENWVIKDVVIQAEPSKKPKLNYNDVIIRLCNESPDVFFLKTDSLNQFPISVNKHPAHIAHFCNQPQLSIVKTGGVKLLKKAEEDSEGYVNALLSQNPAGSVGSFDVTLNQQFLTLGKHKIFVSILPKKSDANNNWLLRGEIQLATTDQNRRQIKVFQFGSQVTPDHVLGNPLDPIEAIVVVKSAPVK